MFSITQSFASIVITETTLNYISGTLSFSAMSVFVSGKNAIFFLSLCEFLLQHGECRKQIAEIKQITSGRYVKGTTYIAMATKGKLTAKIWRRWRLLSRIGHVPWQQIQLLKWQQIQAIKTNFVDWKTDLYTI